LRKKEKAERDQSKKQEGKPAEEKLEKKVE